MITYGDVKYELGEVTENGVTPDDPRIISRVNSAMRAVARAVPRGVFVGGTMSAVVAVDPNSQLFLLPPAMDVALSVEATNGNTLANGWYNVASANALVDPDDLMDMAFVDQGTNDAGIRSYKLPELPQGVTQLLVFGLKAFVGIVDDSTPLYIQNVEAVKFWLLATFAGQKASDLEKAKAYRGMAVEELTSELARHLEDPTRYAARLAQWRVDAASFNDGTLGNMAARLALDFLTGQKLGRIKLYRLLNETAREALQQRNYLARSERYSNVPSGPDPVTFVYAHNGTDQVAYPDFEVLRRLIVAHGPGDAETARGLRKEAFDLIERNLQKSIESSRNSKWHCLIAGYPAPQFGGMRGQIGLEYGGDGGEDGYKVSDGFIARVTAQGWAKAVDHYNFLTRTEDYEQPFLPVPPVAPADDSVIPFPLEIIKLYTESLVVQDKNEAERRGAYATAADALISRNLLATVERARRTTCEAQITLDQGKVGNMVGRLGLEFPSGISLSDSKRRRYVQQAWTVAVDHYNFLTRTEDYEQALLPMPPTIPVDDDVVFFPFEVIKLLVESLIAQDAGAANGYKERGFDLIQRNLVAVVERARRVQAEQQVQTDKNSFGYIKGRLALELPEGLGMSDAKRGRLVNESEELLANSGRWKFMEAQFILAVAPNGTVVVPPDIENIIYAESCGRAVELRDRKWFYAGIATRYGTGWEGWSFTAPVRLIYAGPGILGDANYTLQDGCYHVNAPARPPLRALCRRKWLLKTSDATPMLIQNYPAMKHMVQSLLNKEKADWQGSAIQTNSALKALDNQLGVETEGQVANVTVNIPGLPRGGTTRRAGGWGNRY